MYIQLFQYFTSNNLFHANQYGFRAEYSTELALSELVDKDKDKVSTHSFHGFSQYVKYFLIENYIGTCHVEGCYICRRDTEIRLE